MNPDFSRRVARIKMYEPIRSLPPLQWRAFMKAVHQVDTFEEFDPVYQEYIITAEAERDRRIAAKRAKAAEGGMTARTGSA